jgi:tRNA A-37 threonylcarbamoyl transferase component Bud32
MGENSQETDPSLGAATLDSVPRGRAASASGDSLPGACPACVELVEGSAPELLRETQTLLRRRLRIAATLLFAGFAAFLVRHVLEADFSEPIGSLLFGGHVLTTVVLGAVAAALFSRRDIPIGSLRSSELLVFGLPAAFFLTFEAHVTLESSRLGHLDFPGGIWLVLIYTYALFIPNTLRRAAVVIAAMSAAPLVLLVVMMARYPEVAGQVSSGDLSSLVLMFALAAVGAVFGVDTIGSLRREAFQARQLGRYRLTRLIGAGGMGEVYLAEHQLMKRPCVIKLIRPEKAGDPRTLARFQREVRATARLSHWNTVEIFDYGQTEDGTFYYVMEYLPGLSLDEVVRRFGPMAPERVVHLLRQACDALGEAHAVGLIHRDIKPGNIFAAKRGGVYDVAKLLDFGLVKPLVDQQEPLQLTTEGSITGSPLFMSPEQALGDAPDARSDIYSLGAVGYFLLTGLAPFEGTQPIKVLLAHAHQPVVPPSAHRPDVPSDLEQVILRCLSKRPDQRYQDAAALAEALAGCQAAGRWTRHDAAAWWQRQETEIAV